MTSPNPPSNCESERDAAAQEYLYKFGDAPRTRSAWSDEIRTAYKAGFDAGRTFTLAECSAVAYAKCVRCNFVLATNGTCVACNNGKFTEEIARLKELAEYHKAQWIDARGRERSAKDEVLGSKEWKRITSLLCYYTKDADLMSAVAAFQKKFAGSM